MKPGVYRMNFRGLSLAECWRFSRGPVKFTIALGLKAIGFSGSPMWLPPHEGEADCAEGDLSAEARERLLPLVAELQALGYARGCFSRAARTFDPHMKQGFAYRALHDSGQRSLFIGFVQNDSSGTLTTTVAPTGAMVLGDGTSVEFVNHHNYFDGTKTAWKVAVEGAKVADLDAAMLAYARRQRSPLRVFATLEEMKAFNDQAEAVLWETRIARGLMHPATKGAGATP